MKSQMLTPRQVWATWSDIVIKSGDFYRACAAVWCVSRRGAYRVLVQELPRTWQREATMGVVLSVLDGRYGVLRRLLCPLKAIVPLPHGQSHAEAKSAPGHLILTCGSMLPSIFTATRSVYKVWRSSLFLEEGQRHTIMCISLRRKGKYHLLELYPAVRLASYLTNIVPKINASKGSFDYVGVQKTSVCRGRMEHPPLD